MPVWFSSKRAASEAALLTPDNFLAFTKVRFAPRLEVPTLKLANRAARLCQREAAGGEVGMSQRWLGVYFAKALETLEIPKLLIRWIDEQMGYGVFALETIPKGTFLGCYGGELRRVHPWSPGTTDYWFLYPVGETPWRRLVVDASESGCHTRFFNHSDRPNTLSSSAWRGNLLEIFFYAQKEIPAGTELTYDYGIDYWSQGRRKRPLDI